MSEVSVAEILNIALAVALFVGAIAIGWFIGFQHAKLVYARDRERMEAFKENAGRDLDWLRRQADAISRICGEITKHADRASDTIKTAKAVPIENTADDYSSR